MRALLLGVVVLSVGCGPNVFLVGDGSLGSAERDVAGTVAVRLALPASLKVEEGEPARLVLTGDQNLLPFVETTVTAGELTVTAVPGATLRPVLPLQFTLRAPTLRALTTVSSGSITAPLVKGTDALLRIQSSGSLDVARVEASTLVTEVVSSGEVRVAGGAVKTHQLTIQSSGSVRATGLESANATVVINSSGSAWVWVLERLDATITSSGSVRYLGAPHVTSHVTSSGTVAPIEQ